MRGDGVVYPHWGAGRERHKALPAHAGHGGRTQLRVDPHGAHAGAGSGSVGEAGTGAGGEERKEELLERADRLPGVVVCDWEDTAALLEPITRALDIGLYVGPTPALDLINDDLLATVLR